MLHELQGTDAVALDAVDRRTHRAMRMAIEFVRHEGAVVISAGIGSRRRGQQSPVLAMPFDDRFAEFVQLIDASQAEERMNCQLQVSADVAR